jgi:glycosyltransferase involved in cell wall biosynthesis
MTDRLTSGFAERDRQSPSHDQTTQRHDAHLVQTHVPLAADVSPGWRISAPVRFVRHQCRRVSLIARAFPRIYELGGSPSGLMRKSWNALRSEGIDGIRRRLLYAIATGLRNETKSYESWVGQYDPLNENRCWRIRSCIESLRMKPLISVLMPVYNPNPDWLDEAICSVRRQLYPYWELCIADDASPDPRVRDVLLKHGSKDRRLKIIYRSTHGHISRTSNSAIDLAAGDYLALLDHDDLLPEHALFWVADAINRFPEAGLIYSDEDKLDENGKKCEPYFKCEWNYDLFLSHNMVCHLGVYRADLVRELGGFREGYEGAQDYDLTLRCVERLKRNQIIHTPRVLYHWRRHVQSTSSSGSNKAYALVAGERAINDHLKRCGIAATAQLQPEGCYRVKYALPEPAPLVTLIIPTRNGYDLIRRCITSIVERTQYPRYEIIVINNGSDDPEVLGYLENLKSGRHVRVLCDHRPFNFSALNNAAVESARGDLIGLINNDTEVISPDWLNEMVSIAIQPGVGAVGARLWYPNGTLQHGGIILGVGGVAGHSHRRLARGETGYSGRASVLQSFSAVTAACLVIRKDTYKLVGGLDETNLKVAFNDVDFCLRLREAGYRNIWTPYAELYHYESATRGDEYSQAKQARFQDEVRWMQQRWGRELLRDPAYSPNLTLDREDFGLAWPPRVAMV